MNARLAVALLWSVGALNGCATSTDALVQTAQAALGRGRGVDDAKLDPNLRYLRVTIDGRVVFLALGYYDSHPQGAIEVWYSAEREVLRMQNGRLVGAAGLTTEWRNVVMPELPAWSTVTSGKSLQWVRTRDVMPGYRYGVRDSLVLSVTVPPSKSAVQGLDAQQLTWFEERFADSGLTKTKLPPARYAVQFADGQETVVYGEQCIAPQTCFTWQRWPAGK